MAVDYRLRRSWFRKQGRAPPEDLDAIMTMLHTFGQRAGATEAEWRARLKRQDDEAMAEADRREAENDEQQG